MFTRMPRGNRATLVLSALRTRTFGAAVARVRPRVAVVATGCHLPAVRLARPGTPAWGAVANPGGCECCLHPPELSRSLLAR